MFLLSAGKNQHHVPHLIAYENGEKISIWSYNIQQDKWLESDSLKSSFTGTRYGISKGLISGVGLLNCVEQSTDGRSIERLPLMAVRIADYEVEHIGGGDMFLWSKSNTLKCFIYEEFHRHWKTCSDMPTELARIHCCSVGTVGQVIIHKMKKI
jgi:hypothetical protein